MFRKFILSALLVFSIQAYADVADTVHNSPLSDHESTLTQEEKAVTLQGPIVESIAGCHIAEQTRFAPFFSSDSSYECQGNNNIFNNGLKVIFLLVITLFSFIIKPIVLSVLPKIAYAFGIAKATGNPTDKDHAGMLTFIIATLGIFLMPLIPTKTDNQTGLEEYDFNNKLNLYTYGMIGLYQGIQASNDYYIFKESQNRKVPFMSTTLLNPKNKGFQQAYNAIQFGACISTQTASDQIDINVYYNEATSTYNATSQLGGCALDISATLNEGLIAQGKTAGVDYKAFTDKNFKSYLDLIFSRGVALGTAIAERGEPLPDTDTVGFNKDALERGNEAAYNMAGLDKGGVADLTSEAAKMIGEDATWILARYPGVEMSTVPMNRSVQLCSNVDGGTSYFDKTITVGENMKNCVRTMCADSSGVEICGEAIGYYNYLANDNSLKNPNMVTYIGKFFKEYYQTDGFKEPAHDFINTVSIDTTYNNTEAANYDERTGSKAFTFQVNHRYVNRSDVDWIADAPLNKIEEFNLSGKFESAMMKFMTHDTNGLLGLDYMFDCLAHPNDAHRPNGRMCSNVTNTIAQTGKNLITLGSTVYVATMLNSMTIQSPIDKTLKKAAVGAAGKDLLKQANTYGSANFVVKLIATLIGKEVIEDNFAPYGAELTNEDVALLSVAYMNKNFNDFIQSFGTTSVILGFIMMSAIPFIIILGILSIHILLFFMLISSITLIGAFFRSLMNERIQGETNFFSPVSLLAVIVVAAFTYPVVFSFALRFIDTLAVYQVVDYDSMMTLNGKTPQITDLSSIGTYLFGVIVYVLFLLQLYGNLLKLATKSVFVRIMLIGHSEEDDVYTEIELSTKKTLI